MGELHHGLAGEGVDQVGVSLGSTPLAVNQIEAFIFDGERFRVNCGEGLKMVGDSTAGKGLGELDGSKGS